MEIAANRNLELASRNLEGVKLVAPHALQPYDLLRHDRLFLSKDAAVRLGETLGFGPRTAAPAADVVTIEAAKPAEPRQGGEACGQGKEGSGEESGGEKAGRQGKSKGKK